MRRREYSSPFYHRRPDDGTDVYFQTRQYALGNNDTNLDPYSEEEQSYKQKQPDDAVLVRVKWLLAISSFTSAMLLLILIGVAVIIPYAVKRVNKAEESIAAAVSSENVNGFASSMLHSEQVQQAIHEAILSSLMDMDEEQKAQLRDLFIPDLEEMNAYLIQMANDPEVQKSFANVMYALLSYSPDTVVDK